MSLDGYVAGPNQSVMHPLGQGGEQLHDWAFATRNFRAMRRILLLFLTSSATRARIRAQRIAGHVDRRTTKPYDGRGQKVLLEDKERIRYCPKGSVCGGDVDRFRRCR